MNGNINYPLYVLKGKFCLFITLFQNIPLHKINHSSLPLTFVFCQQQSVNSLLSAFLRYHLINVLIFPHSVQFSRTVVSDSLRPHESQHARPPCPSPTPGIYPSSCPLSQWCHSTISSSVVPFSSFPQSFPASGSFQMSQLFASGGQSIGVSASTSVLAMNTEDWTPLGWTGWISLQSKGLSRVFPNTTVQKHQFFSVQLSLRSNSHDQFHWSFPSSFGNS